MWAHKQPRPLARWGCYIVQSVYLQATRMRGLNHITVLSDLQSPPTEIFATEVPLQFPTGPDSQTGPSLNTRGCEVSRFCRYNPRLWLEKECKRTARASLDLQILRIWVVRQVPGSHPPGSAPQREHALRVSSLSQTLDVSPLVPILHSSNVFKPQSRPCQQSRYSHPPVPFQMPGKTVC